MIINNLNIQQDHNHRETAAGSTIKRAFTLMFTLAVLSLLCNSSLFAEKKKIVAAESTTVTEKSVTVEKSKPKKTVKTPAVKKKKAAAPEKDKNAGKKKKVKTEAEIKKEKLEEDKRKAKWIKETLDYGIQDDRRDAINRILLVKDKSIRAELNDKLIKLLKTEYNSGIKVKALTVMGEIKLGKGTEEMTAMVDDDSEDVKVAAVYALKSNNATSSKGVLVERLKKQDMAKDSRFTEALINVLGDFNATELIKFATETIDNTKTTSNIREIFVLFLGKLKSKEQKDFLIKLYKDEEEELTIRAYAVNSLAKLQIKEATTDIKAVLNEIDSYPFKKKRKYYTLSIYSIAALVKLGDTEAVPRLMNSLKSNNPAVRLKAVNLLKDMKDKRSIDILKYKMKYDPSKKVKKAAEEALKELGVETEEADKEKDKDSSKNRKKK